MDTYLDALVGHRKRSLAEPQSSSKGKRMKNTSSRIAICRASGLRGLYNMGQTCFMSVILQSLLHNPILRNWFLADGHDSTDCSCEDCVSCALNEIFAEFYTAQKVEAYGATTMLLRSWLQEQVRSLETQGALGKWNYTHRLRRHLQAINNKTLTNTCSL